MTPSRKQFDDLEKRRVALGVPREQLCRRADVNSSTYTLLLQQPARKPHFRTVNKLRAALSHFTEEAAS